jgi:hypothetical protein
MSLLPATSHANPTTPFWAVAGSGGGGGAGPVILKQSINRSDGFTTVNPYQSEVLFTFPLPDEIAVGDNYIFSATIYINDWDNANSQFWGNVTYGVNVSDDFTSYSGYASTPFQKPTELDNTFYDESVDIRLTANRGANSNDMSISWQNRTNTPFNFLSLSLNNITFIKLGTGVIQL